MRVVSDNYDMITISLDDIDKKDDEEGTTTALIKGVLAGLKDRGNAIGGFDAYITSDVLIGAGLSSSAAFETIIGTIVSGLYNDMKVSAVDIAIIGQYATVRRDTSRRFCNSHHNFSRHTTPLSCQGAA